MENCPICGKEMEDSRHVSVECFYAVEEVVPRAKKSVMLQEVTKKGSYWGITRRYPRGTRDKWFVAKRGVKKGIKTTKIETRQISAKPVRLLENAIYTMGCCKSCRGDFLRLLGEWSRGEHATPEWGGNICVRELGAIKRITKAEWDERMAERQNQRI